MRIAKIEIMKKSIMTIPAMDLMDGHCVRLRQGDFAQRKNYSDDPVEVAKKFEAAGFRRLHMVDLDGARSGSPKHLSVLEKVASQTKLEIDFSGGLKTDRDVMDVFAAGAKMAAVGSVAVKDKFLFFKWLERFGAAKFLLGVDVREERLAIAGWVEQTDIGLMPFLEAMMEAGVQKIFCTDIGRDGLMAGPAVELYAKILQKFPSLELIASGGVRSPEDVVELERIGCAGAIVGKAIYEKLDGLMAEWLDGLPS